MKITESQLRSIVREELKREAHPPGASAIPPDYTYEELPDHVKEGIIEIGLGAFGHDKMRFSEDSNGNITVSVNMSDVYAGNWQISGDALRGALSNGLTQFHIMDGRIVLRFRK